MIFTYSAREQSGGTRKGLVDAVSVDQAAQVLRGRGLIPTQIKEKTASFGGGLLDRFRGISDTEKAVFTRQLATMIGAGLTVSRALEILVAQTSNPRFREVLVSCLQDVRGGASLSTTLEKHPQSFSPVYTSLLKAGEASGSLDRILPRLADTLERQSDFKSRTTGALIYPSIVVVGMFVVMTLMMVLVIPNLTKMFEDLGASLPLPTRILIFVSHIMSNYFAFFVAALALSAFLLARFSKTPVGSRYMARLSLAMPVFGSIARQSQLTEFTRTLALLVQSGVPILTALDITKGSTGNVLFHEAVERASMLVEKGTPLSSALQSEEMFPASLGQMLAVGEESGKVDEVLFKISSFFERNVDQAVQNISTTMEPIIMVVLGVGVAFLIISIIMPMYSLTTQLK